MRKKNSQWESAKLSIKIKIESSNHVGSSVVYCLELKSCVG